MLLRNKLFRDWSHSALKVATSRVFTIACEGMSVITTYFVFQCRLGPRDTHLPSCKSRSAHHAHLRA